MNAKTHACKRCKRNCHVSKRQKRFHLFSPVVVQKLFAIDVPSYLLKTKSGSQRMVPMMKRFSELRNVIAVTIKRSITVAPKLINGWVSNLGMPPKVVINNILPLTVEFPR